MHAIQADRAIQFEQGVCDLCKGEGRVDVVNRQKVANGTATNADKRKMRCPQCGGKGRAGLRTK